MNTSRAVVASLIAAASLTFGGCVSQRDLDQKDVQIAELERINKELEDQLAARANSSVTQVINAAPVNQAPIDTAKVAVPGANVFDRSRETVFQIEGAVLFSPGSAVLTPAGKETLARIVALAKQKYPNHYLRVEGHTDDQKISRSKDKWDDNWDLGANRARVVLLYLQDRGVAPKDLSLLSYAEQRPVTAGSSDAARKQNRRVEIVAIPK